VLDDLRGWVGVGGCGCGKEEVCDRRKKRLCVVMEKQCFARGWPEGEIHAKRSLA
jgi:hypothetical protein